MGASECLLSNGPFEPSTDGSWPRADIQALPADLRDLMIPPSNQLEALKGDRAGQHSIRINKQWRICFRWQNGDVLDAEIVDYH